MKKILCMIMTFFIAVTSGAVSAGELDFLERAYTSYEETSSLTFELKQPLEILKLFNVGGNLKIIDTQLFFETLADMNMTAVSKVDISSDYKKVKMSVEGKANIPMQINRNLKLTADTVTGMWIDMDFSDEENPKYTYIMQNPVTDKYITADVIALLHETNPENAEQYISFMKMLFNEDTVRELLKTTKKSMTENSSMTKSRGTYTFKFDDKGIKKFCFDIFEKLEPCITAAMDKTEKAEYEKSIKNIKKAVSEFKTVGENGVLVKYTIAGNGNISAAETNVEVDINVYDIIAALTGFSADIDREECNINFELNIKNEYKNVNGTVKVSMPKITAENSVDINELYRQQSMASAEETWFSVETDAYKKYEDGEMAFPLRDITSAFGIPQENISCEDGIITVRGTENGINTFKTANIRENSNVMTVDGSTFELNTLVTEVNGRAFVDTSFVKYLFNAEYSYGTCDMQSGHVTVCFERLYDTGFAVEECDFDDYDMFCIYASSFFKAENGEILMPASDMLEGFNIYSESVGYENGILTVNAKKPFKSLIAVAGSNIITVDGEERKMTSAAVENNRNIYVDKSFAEQAFGVKFMSGEFDIKYNDANCVFEKTE